MTIGHGACEEDMGEIFQEFLGRVENGVTKGVCTDLYRHKNLEEKG